jgi:hypothetical protein
VHPALEIVKPQHEDADNHDRQDAVRRERPHIESLVCAIVEPF